MELSWSTFLLEIVNFLVLVWILQRFFYKPLQSVIARRQQGIEARLAEAENMQREAEQLRQQYENRLDEWGEERRQAHENLQRELQGERARQENELQQALQQQRQRAEAVDQRRQQELHRQLERWAMEQGGQFATRLLEQGAGPELQERLQKMLVQALGELPAEKRAELRAQLTRHSQLETISEPVEVASAFSLSGGQREEIERALGEILQSPVRCHFMEDRELLAGLRVSIGPWVLGASLRDELQAFAQIRDGGR